MSAANEKDSACCKFKGNGVILLCFLIPILVRALKRYPQFLTNDKISMHNIVNWFYQQFFCSRIMIERYVHPVMKHNGKLEESFQQKPSDFPRHYLKGHIQCWDLTCFEIRKSNLTFQQLSLMCRRFWNLPSKPGRQPLGSEVNLSHFFPFFLSFWTIRR